MKQKPTLNVADIELLKKTFATKEEMRLGFASKADLDEAKQEILENQQKFRSDFFEKIDPILKEVSTNRDERIIINHRLEKLEKRVQN